MGHVRFGPTIGSGGAAQFVNDELVKCFKSLLLDLQALNITH
jgi:hypothetical protein